MVKLNHLKTSIKQFLHFVLLTKPDIAKYGHSCNGNVMGSNTINISSIYCDIVNTVVYCVSGKHIARLAAAHSVSFAFPICPKIKLKFLKYLVHSSLLHSLSIIDLLIFQSCLHGVECTTHSLLRILANYSQQIANVSGVQL